MYGTQPDATPGTTAWKEWLARRIEVGTLHLACAEELAPDLVADAAATSDWAQRVPELARLARTAVTLRRGRLARCGSCGKPVRKDEWHVQSTAGDAALLHLECALSAAPEALEAAMRRARNFPDAEAWLARAASAKRP